LRFLAAGAVFVLLAQAFSAPAQAHPTTQQTVVLNLRAGFDGKCKDPGWLPLRVLVENKGNDLEGSIEASVKAFSFSSFTSVYSTPINLPSGGRKQILLYIYLEDYFDKAEVRLVSKGVTLAEAHRSVDCVGPEEYLIGVMANLPPPTDSLVTVATITPEDIPDHGRGLMALDALVISGVDTGSFSQAQRQALAMWLANGGRLVVTGGPGWQKTAAGLQELLPLSPQATVSLDDLSALAAFAGDDIPLAGPAIVTVGKPHDNAEILLSQGEYPLLLRRRYGLGESVYLALDPALKPLYNWKGTQVLYQMILRKMIDTPGWSRGFSYQEIASDAASYLTSLRIPSAIALGSFMCLYLLVVGPLNFLVLSRVKLHQLTWISVPSIAVFFVIMALVVGNRLVGIRPILNQLSIVQVWSGISTARVDGLIGLYSPRRASYELEIGQSHLAHPIFYKNSSTSWRIIEEPETTRISRFKIDTSAVAKINTEGYIPAPKFSNTLKIILGEKTVTLKGTITNESELKLKDAVVLAAGEVVRLGTFSPGDVRNIHIVLKQMPKAGTAASVEPYYGYSYYGYFPAQTQLDPAQTQLDILGKSSLDSDKQTQRRLALLKSAMGENERGWGVTLAGWSDSSPLEIALSSNSFEKDILTLYLVQFDPSLEWQSNTATLTAGLFTWKIEGGSYYEESDTLSSVTIEIGEKNTVEFALSQPISYQSIASMSLEINYRGNLPPPSKDIILSLWDENLQEWVPIPYDWGVVEISEPERFVTPDGIIRLQFDNQSNSYLHFEISDLTLVVER